MIRKLDTLEMWFQVDFEHPKLSNSTLTRDFVFKKCSVQTQDELHVHRYFSKLVFLPHFHIVVGTNISIPV